MVDRKEEAIEQAPSSAKEGSPLDNSSSFFDLGRLTEISNALTRLQKRSRKYLEEFERSDDWRLYKEGFLHLNAYVKPQELVELTTCDLADPEVAFYSPETKKLTIMYDNTRANVNWNNCLQLSCIMIRALNLSQVCKAEDVPCFQNHLRSLIYSRDICKGEEANCFSNAYSTCIKDLAPINVLKTIKTEDFMK